MNPELQKIIEDINRGIVAMREDNDKRLKAIETRGSADVVLEEKVNRAVAELADLNSLKQRLDKIEKIASRPVGTGSVEGDEAVVEARAAVTEFLRTNDASKMRALNTRALSSTSTAGGYTIPREIEAELEKLVVEISEVRDLVTVRFPRTPDYKRNVNKRGAGFAWVAEAGARSGQADSVYDQVSFTHGEGYGLASIARHLLEDSQNDMWGDMMDDVSTALAQGEGVAVFSGNGTDKPTGLLAGTPVSTGDASRAFGTLQYFASGAAATLGTSADLFITVPQSLKAAYRKNATWTMNKLTVAEVMKFKDSTGQYLWQPSVQAGVPSMLRGYPVREIEAQPDIAANAFPIAFGDFKRAYTMMVIGSASMVRDEVTQPGFIKAYVYRRLGGNKVNTEALRLVKCAVS